MASEDRTEGSARDVDPRYALAQLERALRAAAEAADAGRVDDAQRAEGRAARWLAVMAGMADGSLAIGSRRPVRDAPVWATPEVEHGGFATGALLAEGPLQPHERAALAARGESADLPARLTLNLRHCDDAGRRELLARLRDGRYRVTLPEEGALPVLCWLLERGDSRAAEGLLEALAPMFARLRFYPAPADTPLVDGAQVVSTTAGETAARFDAVEQPRAIAAMVEATCVWAPLYEQTVALWLETLEAGAHVLEGAWPCQRYPEGWDARARALLARYDELRAEHELCDKPDHPKSYFFRLREYLAVAARDPAALSGRDVGMVRRMLRCYVERHGAPGSPQLAARRARDARVAARPSYATLAAVVAARLRQLPRDGGAPDVEPLLAPARPAELRDALPAELRDALPGDDAARADAAAMPPHFRRKVERCLEAGVDELVARGVLRSSEALAGVLPQVSAHVRAAGIDDPSLRRLYGAIYRAFRRRRSLLLLDLAQQVRLEELPWVAALAPYRQRSQAATDTARQTLEQMALLALTSFPQTILPNALVQELRALSAAAAGGDEPALPLTNELAADIFMGAFSPPFVRAAKDAARLLEGSLYARYYGVRCSQLAALYDGSEDDGERPLRQRLRDERVQRSTQTFAALCARRAGVDTSGGTSVADNGRVIEQQQILTTHNLASLCLRLDLVERLPAGELAERCFGWIVSALGEPFVGWRPGLKAAKRCAYAWRQMLLFASLDAETRPGADFARWAEQALAETRSPLARARLAPALRGLAHVAAGGRFDSEGRCASGGRQLLGWVRGKHWLVAA